MKKTKLQIIILISIIIIGAVYLFFSNSNKMYELPEYETINPDEITKLTVQKQDNTNTFQRSDNKWVIMPDGYEADPDIMNNILVVISELTLTELISTSGQYNKYELDDDSKTTVTAYNGDEIIRQFDIGRESSSYQHTFLKRINDPDIYQARGNLVEIFNKETDELRDKSVLSFNTEDILIINVKMQDGTEITLNKAFIPAEQNEDTQTEDPQPEPFEVSVWQTADGAEFKTSELDNMVMSLASLKCSSYAEEGIEPPEPLFTITLKGTTEYNLTVYSKIEDNYMASSSMNNYIFYLSSWQVENASGIFALSEE